ncbi:peptide MFS transporter [Gimibacter soli]|uniref:Peptide MFS transporter n=1 Tax=Gimibacter soli TaxID=3024400 RepID=A0AAE9XM38_9PROT|nr:peptide MFS transporter [Gimibacter soli]WCL53393.1 peptide MFS transporter [Gimibacter soli]
MNGTPLNQPRDIMGHPRGLAFIVFTEAWERFSYYGMQALLVLYMAGYLLEPENANRVMGFGAFRTGLEAVFGPLGTQALATQIFGLYGGLIYFTPVIGGWLGDRWLGQQRAVLIGAALMALGHFLMALEAAFLFALLSLIFGAGLLKGNLAAQVGRLYARDDQRRDTAYSLYNMAINVGAFVAPLVCGTLGELYGWHYGFGAAGIGMLVGIVIYLKGRHYLPPDGKRIDRGDRPKLQKGDGTTIAAILALFVVAAMYWSAQFQVWNTYPLWIKERVSRSVFGLEMPVTWFSSLDSLAVLALAPLVILYWRHQRARQAERGDLIKIMQGCFIFGLAYVWLAAGEWLSDGGMVGLMWPVLFHFICAIGFLYVGPVMMALVSRTAPEAVNAMMISAYYLSLFVGGFMSGWLGRFYEPLSPAGFWLLHAAVAGAGALIVLLGYGAFRRMLRLG